MGVYTAEIKKPLVGWTGAYVEVYFPSDTGMKQEYQFTTAGMVFPQKMPYPDCHGEGCIGHLVERRLDNTPVSQMLVFSQQVCNDRLIAHALTICTKTMLCCPNS